LKADLLLQILKSFDNNLLLHCLSVGMQLDDLDSDRDDFEVQLTNGSATREYQKEFILAALGIQGKII